MAHNKQVFSYVGADKCGCVVAIHTVTDPYPREDRRKQWSEALAEGLSAWVMAGYTIHFVTKDEGCRLINLDCPHEESPDTEQPFISEAYVEYLEGLRFGDMPV